MKAVVCKAPILNSWSLVTGKLQWCNGAVYVITTGSPADACAYYGGKRRALPSCWPEQCYVWSLQACRDCANEALQNYPALLGVRELPRQVAETILNYVEYTEWDLSLSALKGKRPTLQNN